MADLAGPSRSHVHTPSLVNPREEGLRSSQHSHVPFRDVNDVNSPPPRSHPVIGIDPGKAGALAIYNPETRSLRVEDVPTLVVGKGKAGKRVVDHYGLARIVDDWSVEVPTVYLELVGAMPGRDASGAAVRTMGAASAFDFGRTFGMLLGVCAAHFLRIELVTPATWKSALKVKGDKDESRQRASTLMPEHSGMWPLKKHDGRAEAVLIALYGVTLEAGAHTSSKELS